MKRILFLAIFTPLFLIISCKKEPTGPYIETSHIESITGEYSIECGIPGGFDSTYISSLTCVTSDMMAFELFNGTVVEARFSSDGLIRVRNEPYGDFSAVGQWWSSNSMTYFDLILHEDGTGGGYLPFAFGDHMDVEGVKL